MQISLNFATSLDGKIASAKNGSANFTSQADLDRLHHLRSEADALLVGRGTLDADQTTLTIPGLPLERQPLRCAVSRSGNFDPAHPIFQKAGDPIHLLATDPEKLLDPERFPNSTLHQTTLQNFLLHLEKSLTIK